MGPVLNCLASACFMTAAVVRLNDGLSALADTAASQATINLAEFRAHQCGALKAAMENLAIAASYLAQDPELAHAPWDDTARSLASALEASLPDLDCADAPVRLHTESQEATPRGLPNVIYRFTWHDYEVPNG